MLALESYNCTYQNLRFSPSFQLCALTACKSIRFKNLQPSIKFSDCIQPTASLQNLVAIPVVYCAIAGISDSTKPLV